MKSWTGRLFSNNLLQLRPVGRCRFGDVQLTLWSSFKQFYFLFIFNNFFTMEVGQEMDPESLRIKGFVVPCRPRERLVDP